GRGGRGGGRRARPAPRRLDGALPPRPLLRGAPAPGGSRAGRGRVLLAASGCDRYGLDRALKVKRAQLGPLSFAERSIASTQKRIVRGRFRASSAGNGTECVL